MCILHCFLLVSTAKRVLNVLRWIVDTRTITIVPFDSNSTSALMVFRFWKKMCRVLYMKSLSDALRDKSIIPIEFRFSKAHKNFFLHFRSSAILLSLCSRSIYSPKWNGCSPKCFFIFYRCAFSGFYRHKERLSKYIIFLFLCDTNNYSIKKKIFGCLECYHILLLCSCCSMACSSDQIFW